MKERKDLNKKGPVVYTFDHQGNYMEVTWVNTARLPGRNKLDYEVYDPNEEEPDKKKKRKKQPKKELDGIDASKVFHNTDKSDREFMDNGNAFPPAATDAISLQAGVTIQEGNWHAKGPDLDRGNRMTLDEYFKVAEENNQIRYNQEEANKT